MKKAAPKIHATTQKFIEIVDISDKIVLLHGGNACLVIEITANNFTLLSQREQDAKIYAYASLLNSLTFPIQLLIRNKLVDISSYVKTLEEEERRTENQLLAKHIGLYRDFVHQMVKVNAVLNKQFYIVISYSPLEAGVTGAKQAVGKTAAQDVALETARKTLQAKADTMIGQLKRLAVSAKVLEKEELVKLFYDIFNEDLIDAAQLENDVKAPIVKQITNI